MNLPCPRCSRTVSPDHMQPDGTVVCPHCATQFSSVSTSENVVLNDRERESRTILKLLRFMFAIAAAALAAYALIEDSMRSSMTFLLVAASVSVATLLYIAEQVLLIKGYARASTDRD